MEYTVQQGDQCNCKFFSLAKLENSVKLLLSIKFTIYTCAAVKLGIKSVVFNWFTGFFFCLAEIDSVQYHCLLKQRFETRAGEKG